MAYIFDLINIAIIEVFGKLAETSRAFRTGIAIVVALMLVAVLVEFVKRNWLEETAAATSIQIVATVPI